VFVQFVANFWKKIDNGKVIGNIDFSILYVFAIHIFPCFSNFFLTTELKFVCKAYYEYPVVDLGIGGRSKDEKRAL